VRRRKDGTLVDISLTVSPIRDAAGRILGASKIARDISEQKRAEAGLREADRRKNEFLAMLAHELRGPLAPLRYALEVVRLAADDPASVRAAAETMARQVGHLVRLVDDLLDLGRIERGKVELRKERVELGAVARQAVETVRPLCDAKDQTLAVTIGAEPIRLSADPVRLVQVLGNLLHNAMKFTSPGGQIGLAVERLDDSALVFVRDTGIGIAAEQLPRIFEMFVQAESPRDRSPGGLGVGLALARDLVEMHGGRLEARSAGRGQGSEFVVTLPLGEAPAERAGRVGAVPEGETPRRRVLVVDDNRDTAAMLAKQLEISGHEARVAHDGAEALSLAETFLPDTAILDIGLPGLDGYELARRIREAPWGQSMVLVAATGWGQPEDRRLSREAGFDDHLVKPVEPSALGRWLDRPTS
jgi:signal transduction histidine kinase/CheY-like chemotaxis protein